jgi:hypothetical protein
MKKKAYAKFLVSGAEALCTRCDMSAVQAIRAPHYVAPWFVDVQRRKPATQWQDCHARMYRAFVLNNLVQIAASIKCRDVLTREDNCCRPLEVFISDEI